jgi:outer membrane protein TolC
MKTQRARAQQARVDRADRDAYPDVTVSTSYNSMWDMPEHRWMVGLGFNLPIWSGGRTGAAEEATAMRAQFESDARRLEDAARTQVFVSLKQLDESRHVLRLFEERLLPIARDRIDAARAGFTASRNPFTAVVEAERNLRRSSSTTRWRAPNATAAPSSSEPSAAFRHLRRRTAR